MPDTYEATDPKTGQKWTWDGSKWNPAGPSTYEKLKNPISPDLDEFSQRHPILGVPARVASGAGAAVIGAPEAAYGAVRHPIDTAKGLFDAIKAYGNKNTWKGIPSVLPEALGFGAGGYLAGEAGSALTKPVFKAAGEATKPALRYISGAGEQAVKKVSEAETAKQTGMVEKATAKREAAKGKFAEDVREQREKAIQASAKETAAKTKQEALATKHGTVAKRMNEMADEAQQHIQEVEAKVGKQESAKWQAFKEKMDNPTVKTGSVVNAIEEASAGLAGENVPIFKSILNEIAEEDPMSQASVFKGKGAVDIKELMAKAAPAVRDRLIRDLEAQGFTEESGFASRAVDLPLDNARQLYTRIGRVLNARELPRPVARAIGNVQEALDQNIAQSIAKKGGPEALREYRGLQKDYRQYRETFSDRDSPLRKVTEAKDPNTKLNPITGEMGQRAVDYLGRYRNLGAKPEVLGKIRAMHKALKELSSGGGKAPGGPVERPSLPKVPEMQIPSAEEIRRNLLQKRGSSISAMPSGMMFFSPKWMLMRMIMKKALEKPGFVDWLAKDKTSGQSAGVVP